MITTALQPFLNRLQCTKLCARTYWIDQEDQDSFAFAKELKIYLGRETHAFNHNTTYRAHSGNGIVQERSCAEAGSNPAYQRSQTPPVRQRREALQIAPSTCKVTELGTSTACACFYPKVSVMEAQRRRQGCGDWCPEAGS